MNTEHAKSGDGRKHRWTQHNADRRRDVINAALAVLERDDRPGEWVTAQQIADEAHIHRTGIYRHFADRADLDIAIQRTICDQLQHTLTASVVLEGMPRSVVQRTVATYVEWVVAHPAWTYVIEQNVAGTTESPLQETIARVADQIETAVEGFLVLVDAQLTSADLKLVGPWVSSLIAGGVGAVRTWRTQRDAPPLETVAAFIADTIWLQITGLGASRGIHIPKVPLERLYNGARL
ncbi:TetR/AcrR family transcriptional regulator [Rhodococcus sp. G-MC3]|uniref:TetR/AcrR family transcriptional regulator n=1 Tax=Rhodococcus sp. G-MC3 TaxID=3046209 RepID=UPI0024B8B426|nr:TetR/AcrR family transcriptional regulator [Rhodococcus sp. G-MC3]MDJ0392464.1 TetR/AcrR family transcriptional regulator [Rhodococcus sp. G-MC3]